MLLPKDSILYLRRMVREINKTDSVYALYYPYNIKVCKGSASLGLNTKKVIIKDVLSGKHIGFDADSFTDGYGRQIVASREVSKTVAKKLNLIGV